MMQPKKTKYRKAHKGRVSGAAKGGYYVAYGEFALKAVTPERITARQIEAARRAISRHVKRTGRMWIRIFPDVPVTKKPAEVRMGSGKGSVEYWMARVEAGRILFEIDGVPESVAREAFDRASRSVRSRQWQTRHLKGNRPKSCRVQWRI
jgi:large subunit ribosomal protein L16